MPRRIRYQVAASLDGYIAGPGGEYDWIPRDPDIDFEAMFAEFDVLLMGRKTYETYASGPPTGHRVVVLSRTLRPEEHPGVTVLADHVAEGVEALRREEGKDIWLFGGGETFRSLLGLGLVDQVEVAVVPVLLGGGVSLLPSPAGRATLELRSHRLHPESGIVTLRYDVRS